MKDLYRFYAITLALVLFLSLLSGCTRTVYVDRVIEVKVPVTVPCIVDKPIEVEALRDSVGREQWDALTTDQRENLLAVQALAHKVFGDRLTAASAGCR